jgi:hypothetical protein
MFLEPSRCLAIPVGAVAQNAQKNGCPGARSRFVRQALPGSGATTGGYAEKSSNDPGVFCVLRSFSRHIFRNPRFQGMEGNPPTSARDRTVASVDCDPVLCFAETDPPDPRPRVLVGRLLHARALLGASPVLASRFRLGDCAAAHHIVLGNAMTGVVLADRLMAFGFRVEPSADPPGIRFFVTSSHSEAEIRALLVAIAIAVRELIDPDGPPAPACGVRRDAIGGSPRGGGVGRDAR